MTKTRRAVTYLSTNAKGLFLDQHCCLLKNKMAVNKMERVNALLELPILILLYLRKANFNTHELSRNPGDKVPVDGGKLPGLLRVYSLCKTPSSYSHSFNILLLRIIRYLPFLFKKPQVLTGKSSPPRSSVIWLLSPP